MTGTRRAARHALAAAGLRPRRRLGQHFLCNPAIARRIVEVAGVDPETNVLEIGPGLGALTDLLAVSAKRLHLVEIDADLATQLTERYADRPSVRVISGDVLTVPLDELIPDPRVTVVANLPYNVAVPILFRLLELRRRFPRAVVMVQREVAERLVAPARAEARGILSVLIQTFAEVRIAFRVSPRSFLPVPRVESAGVDVRWSAMPRVDVAEPDLYKAIVRAAFGQRRKTLRNALTTFAAGRGLDRDELAATLARSGIDPGARAETLELDDFARLSRALAG
jgi:16S rRNA (adenine1518-N6/adenine1519-N6)-dimethyltransferase